MSMASLGFDLLDRHVVHGRADEPAVVGSHTFSRLLDRFAGGRGEVADRADLEPVVPEA